MMRGRLDVGTKKPEIEVVVTVVVVRSVVGVVIMGVVWVRVVVCFGGRCAVVDTGRRTFDVATSLFLENSWSRLANSPAG